MVLIEHRRKNDSSRVSIFYSSFHTKSFTSIVVDVILSLVVPKSFCVHGYGTLRVCTILTAVHGHVISTADKSATDILTVVLCPWLRNTQSQIKAKVALYP